MMKKHDETIQNLFEEYAETLTPRQDLAEKAKMQMVESKARPSTSARKNSSFGIHFAWIAPVAVVFVAIIAIIFTLPMFNGGDGPTEDNNPPQQSIPTVAYYSFADVKGKKSSIEDYDDILQISRLVNNDYQIVGQRCYAFFTEEGELRYIKVQLGVRSSNGTFTELELIGEVDGYVRADLQDIYDNYKSLDGLGTYSHYAENGEYVTNGYFAARNMHFYVVARNGQATQVATRIMEIISA